MWRESSEHILEVLSLISWESDSNLKIHDLSGINRNTLIVAWLKLQIIKSSLNIFLRYWWELSSKYSLFFAKWNVSSTDIKYLKTNIFSFFITIEPQDYKIYSVWYILQMLCYCSWRPIELSYCWCFKQYHWVLSSILIIKWKISVINMTCYRCNPIISIIYNQNYLKEA